MNSCESCLRQRLCLVRRRAIDFVKENIDEITPNLSPKDRNHDIGLMNGAVQETVARHCIFHYPLDQS